jgi:hypothetical protein
VSPAYLTLRPLMTRFQLLFHATTAEALSAAQGEIEELSVSAEGEYR